MKKCFLILFLAVSFLIPSKQTRAQSLHLDSIFGFPDTVVDNENVFMTMAISNSGGAIFSGELAVYIHSVGTDSSTTKVLYIDSAYTISGNTTGDTISLTYTFKAADFDGGDNIVVVWPASANMPGGVSGDSLTFNLFFKNVGIAENERIQSVLLFPGASGNEIRLLYAYPEKIERVRIIDGLGKCVSESSTAVSNLRIDFLPAGIYYVEVLSRDRTRIVKKFFRE